MLDFKAETFLSVCRHMNFTRASEELHITQPAVTQQIHSLENYYSARLFNYSNRTLTLTSQGEYLRIRLEAMYHDVQRMKDELSQIEDSLTFTIGTTMSAGDYILPQYFAEFIKSNPNVKLNVTKLDTRDILELLNSGKLDFAFIEGYVRKDIYSVMELKRDEIIMVCNSLSEAKSVTSLNELLNFTLLLREEGSGTREIFSRYLNENGLSEESFKTICEFNSPTMIKKLLIENCGISALYRSVVSDSLESKILSEIKIDGLPIEHSYSAVWKKESLYADYYKKIVSDMINLKKQ